MRAYIKESMFIVGLSMLSGVLHAETPKNVANNISAKNFVNVLDDYYKEVNKQLDKRLDRSREPFASRLPAESSPVSIQEKHRASVGVSKSVHRASGRALTSLEGVPVMSVKGYLENDGERAALLEVEEIGVFVVREGDKVGLQKMAGLGSVLNVLEINELNLTLSIGTSKDQIVVQ